MNTPKHKRYTNISASVLILLSITLATGCSQKPGTDENSAQIKAAVDKAVAEAKQQFIADQQAAEKTKLDATAKAEEKRKQEAAAQAGKKRRIAGQRGAADRANSQQVRATTPPPIKRVCANCGVVAAITPVATEAQGSGLGVIAGGVLGGLLGHQLGNGSGRDLATFAGAVGGAVAGNKIEKNAKKATSYDITVRLDNGETVKFNQATVPALALEERVKIENGQVVKY
ncbi:MAG: glycine zipper 2TM domain-containing protein [Gallionella sp.]